MWLSASGSCFARHQGQIRGRWGQQQQQWGRQTVGGDGEQPPLVKGQSFKTWSGPYDLWWEESALSHQSEEKQEEEWEGQRSERKRTTAASHLRLFVLMMKMQHVCRVSWKVVFPVGGGQCWPDLLTSYLFVMEQKEKAAVFGLKDSLEENRQTFFEPKLTNEAASVQLQTSAVRARFSVNSLNSDQQSSRSS